MLLKLYRRQRRYALQFVVAHIEDDSLELYTLGRVSPFEAASIEEHLLVCPLCRQNLQSAGEFAKTMREATRVAATELIASHRTEDGLVHVYVRPAGSPEWLATLRGGSITCGVLARSRSEAIDLCLANFRELFPEHECDGECSDGGAKADAAG